MEIAWRLPAPIETRLGVDDDPLLWEALLRAAAEDALAFSGGRSSLYATVGSCSHWLRPHQSRWTAGGGFAAPLGYGKGKSFLRGVPGLDWSVTLQFDRAQSGWVCPEQAPSKRFVAVRFAIPARTASRRQAAVHAIWPPGTLDPKQELTVFYGFRKSEDGCWRLVAGGPRDKA